MTMYMNGGKYGSMEKISNFLSPALLGTIQN